MDPVNDPRFAVVGIRCAACRRSLGRWAVSGTSTYPEPRGRTSRLIVEPPAHLRDERWRERLVPLGADGQPTHRRFDLLREEPAPPRPRFERGAPDVLDLTCSCRRGFQRRRVRISAVGLRRLLARLGWPDEVEL